MPEHYRALVVIIGLAAMTFTLAAKPAQAILGHEDFARQRNSWFALVVCAFVIQSFWIYAAAAGLLLLFQSGRVANTVALFYCLLFVMPNASVPIPGFGLINYLFALSHVRLLVLCILLPAFLQMQQNTDRAPFGSLLPDKFLAAYLILLAGLFLRETSVTDTLRQCFYLFIDVFLPYYVVSRSLKNPEKFRQALMCFLLASLALAAIAAFECVKQWLLFKALMEVMGLDGPLRYLDRSGFLRASGTVGNIPLGYVMMVALTFFSYLRSHISSTLIRRGIFLVLAAGLVAPLSRGPWVGALATLIVYIALGEFALRRLAMLGIGGTLTVLMATLLPGGQKVIGLLPFIGSIEVGNIDYREQLIENASTAIARNPLFGSVNYLQTPEMQAMRNGEGLIDVVNTYIGIALESGLVGLTLFVGFFLCIGIGTYQSLRSLNDGDEELRLLGRALLAGLAGILVTIFTVSSVTIIPIVYWTFAGLCVAYVQMVRAMQEESEPWYNEEPLAEPAGNAVSNDR